MKTRITELLGIEYPIIQGGMGVGVSLSNLAGNVAANGGVGIISTAQIGFRHPDFAKNPIEEIDHFVLHQANIRIIEGVAKRLKADYNKFPTNLKNVGNMSSATIPVLLDELNRAGAFKKGEKIVLSGFGAGLTYGACVMNW